MLDRWQTYAVLALAKVAVLALASQAIPVSSFGQFIYIVGIASRVVGFLVSTAAAASMWWNA